MGGVSVDFRIHRQEDLVPGPGIDDGQARYRMALLTDAILRTNLGDSQLGNQRRA